MSKDVVVTSYKHAHIVYTVSIDHPRAQGSHALVVLLSWGPQRTIRSGTIHVANERVVILCPLASSMTWLVQVSLSTDFEIHGNDSSIQLSQGKNCRTSVSLADNNNNNDDKEERKERMAVKVEYGAIRPFVC